MKRKSPVLSKCTDIFVEACGLPYFSFQLFMCVFLFFLDLVTHKNVYFVVCFSQMKNQLSGVYTSPIVLLCPDSLTSALVLLSLLGGV